MAKTIEILVMSDGSVKVEARGFKGMDCEQATAFIEKALGRVTGKQKKPEFYRQVRKEQRVGT